MQPRFNSISAYEDEISKQQLAVKALNKQQFNLMLKNDVAGMAALDSPIKQAEADIDDLKLEMGGVMGAYVYGKQGNQLLDDDSQSYVNGMLHAYGNIGDGLIAEQEQKDEAAQQGMLHAYGNVGKGLTAEQERKDEAAQQGMLHAYGNVGNGLAAGQERKEEGKKSSTLIGEHLPEKDTLELFKEVGGISNVVGNAPYKNVLDDIAQISDLSQVDDAQIIDVMSGDGRNDVLEIYMSEVIQFEEKADTVMGYYGVAKSIMDMVTGLLDQGSKAVDVLETVKEVMEESGQFTPEEYDKLSAQIMTEGRYLKIDKTDTILRPFGGSDTYYYTVMVELDDSNKIKQPYHTYVYTRNMNSPAMSPMNPKQALPMWYNYYYEYK